AHLCQGDHAGIRRTQRRAGGGHVLNGRTGMAQAALAGRVAVVTGAGRGLGRAMAVGLARAGAVVIGAAHIATDFAERGGEASFPARILPIEADLRRASECDRVVAAAVAAGGVDVLVNNAGLTLTYVCPDLYRRPAPPKFWELGDEIGQNVMD